MLYQEPCNWRSKGRWLGLRSFSFTYEFSRNDLEAELIALGNHSTEAQTIPVTRKIKTLRRVWVALNKELQEYMTAYSRLAKDHQADSEDRLSEQEEEEEEEKEEETEKEDKDEEDDDEDEDKEDEDEDKDEDEEDEDDDEEEDEDEKDGDGEGGSDKDVEWLDEGEVNEVEDELDSLDLAPLHIPSNLLKMAHKPPQVTIAMELRLRQGQMNDAITGLKSAIALKSTFYGKLVRGTRNSQRARKGAMQHVEVTNAKITKLSKVYNRSREVMLRLGPTPDIVSLYKPIKEKDLSSSTAPVHKVDAKGVDRRRKTIRNLPWFWSMGKPLEGTDGWIAECKPFIPINMFELP